VHVLTLWLVPFELRHRIAHTAESRLRINADRSGLAGDTAEKLRVAPIRRAGGFEVRW